MALIVFEHHPLETPAVLGTILLNYGHRLRVIALHDGEPIPPDLDDVDGIISMGGPMNIDQPQGHPWMADELAYLKQAHEAGLPIVGICLGAQLIAAALDGKVEPMATPEVGWHPLKLAFAGTTDPILAGTPWQSMQFHVHGREITQLPPGGVGLASSQATRVQAFRVGLWTYGFQFHFEWDRRTLDIMAADPLAEAAQVDSQTIRSGTEEHYASYRRLSDRLCHNVAQLLLPIDKR